MVVQRGVDSSLEHDTNDTEKGHCKSDVAGSQTQATVELEWGMLLMQASGGSAEEDGPQAGEGTEMAGDNEVGEHSAHDVGGPDAPEG